MLENRRRLKKQLELLKICLKNVENGKFDSVFGSNNSFYLLFYDSNNKLDENLLYITPVEQIPILEKTITLLSRVSSYSANGYSGHGCVTLPDKKLAEYIRIIIDIISNYIDYLKSGTVFFSWQSDLPSSTNTDLLQECLEEAIKRVNDKFDLKLRIDRDTHGKSGSPDIISSILGKIDNAFAFVGDISIVAYCKEIRKYICNQNVMFEAGYAINEIGLDRTIFVCNTSIGQIRDLPFDIGHKRIITYKCSKKVIDKHQKEIKEDLINQLSDSLELIVKNNI